jgi:hypothetical protein
MQTNTVIKSAALVIAPYLPLLSYRADAEIDTPHYNYAKPEGPHQYYVRPEMHPVWPDFENGYGANTRADTGSSDAPGAQYPDVRE